MIENCKMVILSRFVAVRLANPKIITIADGGGLSGHRNGGTWATGVGNDGRLRNGIPFEPLCNCPGLGANWQTLTDAGAGETILMSEMWEGLITAGMFDQLNFIEPSGDRRGD